LSDNDWQNVAEGATTIYGEDAGCSNNSPDIDACDPTQSLDEYGRLYNWYAVVDARGVCPSGWHVPTDGEWTVLTDYLGGEPVAGVQMKMEFGWVNNTNGSNASGFSGLPGGYRDSHGSFFSAGDKATWWSSSLNNDSSAWYRFINENESVARYGDFLTRGFSVRCIQDTE
jgi:uncharacterized protein (TIGR02145 family)